MKVFAKRTKIKSNLGTAVSTAGWAIRGAEYEPYGIRGQVSIDSNAYAIASASISVNRQSYIPRLSSKAKEILQKLSSFKKLPENWDRNNAAKPLIKSINSAYEFVEQSDECDLPLYFTAPGPNGEIVVEFKKGDFSAEVYFNEDGSREMILYTGKNQVIVNNVSIHILTAHFSTAYAYGA